MIIFEDINIALIVRSNRKFNNVLMNDINNYLDTNLHQELLDIITNTFETIDIEGISFELEILQ